jgi:hypothetical protein
MSELAINQKLEVHYFLLEFLEIKLTTNYFMCKTDIFQGINSILKKEEIQRKKIFGPIDNCIRITHKLKKFLENCQRIAYERGIDLIIPDIYEPNRTLKYIEFCIVKDGDFFNKTDLLEHKNLVDQLNMEIMLHPDNILYYHERFGLNPTPFNQYIPHLRTLFI